MYEYVLSRKLFHVILDHVTPNADASGNETRIECYSLNFYMCIPVITLGLKFV